VAIDPAVTSGEEADETGIVVAGKDKNGHGYVLADISLPADRVGPLGGCCGNPRLLCRGTRSSNPWQSPQQVTAPRAVRAALLVWQAESEFVRSLEVAHC
jgi:hypothetical protein